MKKVAFAFVVLLGALALYYQHSASYRHPNYVQGYVYASKITEEPTANELAVINHLNKNHRYCEYLQAGAIKYITCDGKKIGGGYHTYFLTKEGIVLGRLGASEEIVVDSDGLVATIGGSDKMDKDEQDAETAALNQLGKDWDIEQAGAIKYLHHKGLLMSKGYHQFFVRGGKVWGRIGAYEEPVSLSQMREHKTAI